MKMISYRYSLLTAFMMLFAACATNENSNTGNPEELQVQTLADNLYGGTGGLSVDSLGNIYSSDFGPFLGQVNPNFKVVSKVFRISPVGEVEVFLDSLQGASGSVFDSRGNFFQSNIRGDFITKVTPEGEQTIYVSDSINSPVGVIVDKKGGLIVCNCGNNTLRRITEKGENVLFSKGKVFKCPNGITKDDEGNFYVANFYDGNVIKVTTEGRPSVLATIPGNNNGHLTYRDNYLYVVARSAHQIYRVSLQGEVDLFAGNGERGRKNGNRLEASFSLPNDLEFSPDGRYLYVNEIADSLGSPRILLPTTVRKIRIK